MGKADRRNRAGESDKPHTHFFFFFWRVPGKKIPQGTIANAMWSALVMFVKDGPRGGGEEEKEDHPPHRRPEPPEGGFLWRVGRVVLPL